jgi:hypothetical protein
MKITAGKVVPSIVAATSLIETKVGYEVAEQIADVIVALEGERMKIEILQKNVLGGRDRVESSDPDYDDIVKEMEEINEREIDLKDLKPIDASLLRDSSAEVFPSSLASLKISGLLA